MRNIFRYIVCACLALALGGCIKDEIVGNSFCREGLLSLNIGINETRAAGDNDNGNADLTDGPKPLNENRIDNYEVFLFASGDTGEAKFSTYVSGVDAKDSTTNDAITVPAGALADLFASSDTCNIYVVANLGKSLATEFKNASTQLTLANLKAHIVSANFATPEVIEGKDLPEYNSAPIQDNFVMDSSGTDTVTKSGNNLTGEVYITRAASKISFMAYIGESMTIDKKVWRPDLANIKVAFNNVVVKGAIDNGSDTEDTFTMPQVDSLYKNLAGVQLMLENKTYTQTPEFDGKVEGVENWSKLDIVVPFYTYSSIWNETEDKVDPSIVLTVPWFVEGNKSTTLTNYNYTIPLIAANGDLKLVRNKHYRIALRVGVLGDLDQLASSEFSYEVLDWVGNDIMVDLSDPKYFVVEKDYVEVYNENSYSVDFSASDIVSAEIISIIKPDYSERKPIEDNYIYGSETSTSGAATVNGSSLKADSKGRKGNENPFTVMVDNSTDDGDGKSITLTHTLNNDMENTGFDYIPYTVTVRATMTITDSAGNTSTMVKDITFKQYPEMYISADLNSDYDNDSDVNGNRGYAWVNNSYNTLGSLNGFSTGNSNSNPSMITITTTALKGSDFVIGDPRSIDVNNLGYSQFVSAPSVQGNTRSLSYYYPTRSTDEAKSIISPKFRIASSYGLTSSISITNARYRCASYQEDGYPAGRWRIPTAAEIKYIVTLSARGFITILFNDDGNYWAANGYIYVPDYDNGGSVTQTTGSSAYVRCVYDEWYWGSEPIADKTKFTWGDEPRQ